MALNQALTDATDEIFAAFGDLVGQATLTVKNVNAGIDFSTRGMSNNNTTTITADFIFTNNENENDTNSDTRLIILKTLQASALKINDKITIGPEVFTAVNIIREQFIMTVELSKGN